MSYKQEIVLTDIGYLAKDWEIKTLEQVSHLMTNGFVGTATSHYVDEQNGVLYIQGYNVEQNSFNFNGIKYVSKEFHARHLKSQLKEGDLLTIQTGDVGLTTFVNKELEGSNCHALIITRLKSDVCDYKFISHYLNSHQGRVRLKLLEIGSTMKHLNVGDLLDFKVPTPSLDEQQKIAQALTEADDYICALENLIEKKKMIKEGLMVNLLTGKQRLKEFAYNEDDSAKGYKDSELGKIPEDWNVGNLGNLTTLKARIGWQGLTVAEYLDQGDYYLVTGTDFNEGFIDFDNCPYVDRSRYLQDPNIQLKTNDVLVTKDGTIGKVAFIENLDLPATLNSGVFVVRPIGSGINSKFLYYILMSKYFDNFLKKITAGSTITHLYQKDFVHFDFVLPTIEEQNLIVNCLSNIDNDLKLLVTKLNKAKNIKQGMMQKLLTGEIRLA